MMTLQEVQSALKSSDPWDGMHNLVMRDLHCGRSIEAVRDQIVEWYPLIDESEFGEDGYDAFAETMDGLTGNCMFECTYRAIFAKETMERPTVTSLNSVHTSNSIKASSLPSA